MAKAPQLDLCIFCDSNPCVCNARSKAAPKPRKAAAPKPAAAPKAAAPAPVVKKARPDYRAAMAATATVTRTAPAPSAAPSAAPVAAPVAPVAPIPDPTVEETVVSTITARRDAGRDETAAALLVGMLGARRIDLPPAGRDDPAFQAQLIRERNERT